MYIYCICVCIQTYIHMFSFKRDKLQAKINTINPLQVYEKLKVNASFLAFLLITKERIIFR